MKNLLVLTYVALIFVSCSEAPKSEVQSEEQIDKEIKTLLKEEEEKELEQKQEEDSIPMEEKPDEELTDEELEVKTEKVELKVLSKVTFCDCIKKQKELDDKLMETEDDAEMDNILAEMDKLTEGECKNLMADKSSSPEAREERKAKIAACLGN